MTEPTEHTEHPGPEAATANHALQKISLDDPFVLDSRFHGHERNDERRVFAPSRSDNGVGDADFALMLEEFAVEHPYERIYRDGVPAKEMEAARERRKTLKALRPAFEEFNCRVKDAFKELQRRHCRISRETRILFDVHLDRNHEMELELCVLNKAFSVRR